MIPVVYAGSPFYLVNGPDAVVVSDTIPSSMISGASYQASVTMRNTGSTIWAESSFIRMGGVGDFSGDAAEFSYPRITIPAGVSVIPGQEHTFIFTMTAPGSSGTYRPEYRMVWDGNLWFGETLSKQVQVSNLPMDSVMISDTIPASMTPGSRYAVTIIVKNNGSMPWNETAMIRLGGVEDFSGDAAAFTYPRISLPGGVNVEPGQQYSFSFYMTAPDMPGAYEPEFRMVWDGHRWFGGTLKKQVQVSGTLPDAEVVANTIPSSMSPGISYNVSVTMRNTGGLPWSGASLIRLGGVGDFSGEAAMFSYPRVTIPGGIVVSPGSAYTFNFSMIAPLSPGSYHPSYRMVQDGNRWFGGTLSVNVTVISPSYDKFSLWNGETKLRGASVGVRKVYPELDGPTFLGTGAIGPPYTQVDIDRLSSWGANVLLISHPGLFEEKPPYILNVTIQDSLDRFVAMAEESDMFAVIAFRTGPGRSEFTFHIGETWFPPSYYNDEVWRDPAAQQAWTDMWRYTANRYKNNSVVVGYELMVEPNANHVWFNMWDPEEFYALYKNTTYDWNPLHARITSAIREVDAQTPVIVDGMSYSGVEWMPYIVPNGDARTVYTVHQYSPHEYTHQEPDEHGGLPLTYPGMIWGEPFNKSWLESFMGTVDAFKAKYNVTVAATEYGAMRWEPGVDLFINDEMDIFEERGMGYSIWSWETAWKEYTDVVNAFNFRLGPYPHNTEEVPTSQLIEAIRSHWANNVIRPSDV